MEKSPWKIIEKNIPMKFIKNIPIIWSLSYGDQYPHELWIPFSYESPWIDADDAEVPRVQFSEDSWVRWG